MRTVSIDVDKSFHLEDVNELIELENEGKVVGVYVPHAMYHKMLYAWAESQCPFTKEELEERRQQTGGSSLADMWKRLGRT